MILAIIKLQGLKLKTIISLHLVKVAVYDQKFVNYAFASTGYSCRQENFKAKEF